MPKYQGKEITATLQANTKVQLDKLISGLNRYARANHLETVKVLSKAKDPDGGYKAIVEAHNWNPLKVARERYENRPTPEAKIEAQKKKVALKEAKEALKKKEHAIEMEELRRKNEKAQALLKAEQIKKERKALKGPSFLGSIANYEPKKKQRSAPKKKKRKTAQPRMVTLRI